MESAKKLNILIADDEEGLRFSLASILEIEGYDVKTAGDGLEAIELVKQNDFDVAFFDIRMPGMNGVDAFKKIKEISPETIVVMMTAYAMNDLIKEAIKEGAFACISKPFEIEDILNTVKEINSKANALIICKDTDAEIFLDENLKGAGFIVINKKDLPSSMSFIERRSPELIFIEPSKDDIEQIKKLSAKNGKSKIIIISSSECKEADGLKGAKCVRKPISKSDISEFFSIVPKRRAAIISSDTISANNLKLSVIAKGYDGTYYPAPQNFFDDKAAPSYDFIICDSGVTNDIEAFYKKVKDLNQNAKVIFIFDFESPLNDSLKKLNISFLQRPFDPPELIKLMEKQ